MLLTLSIILILFILMWGKTSAQKARQQLKVCERNLHDIQVALNVYALDRDGAFPSATNALTSEVPLSLLIPTSTSVTRPFICPATKDRPLPEAEPFADLRISYAYYMGRTQTGGTPSRDVLMSDRQVNTASKQRGDPVFSPDGKPPADNHREYGGNFLFVDGHVERGESRAAFDLPTNGAVVLLNPRP